MTEISQDNLSLGVTEWASLFGGKPTQSVVGAFSLWRPNVGGATSGVASGVVDLSSQNIASQPYLVYANCHQGVMYDSLKIKCFPGRAAGQCRVVVVVATYPSSVTAPSNFDQIVTRPDAVYWEFSPLSSTQSTELIVDLSQYNAMIKPAPRAGAQVGVAIGYSISQVGAEAPTAGADICNVVANTTLKCLGHAFGTADGAHF